MLALATFLFDVYRLARGAAVFTAAELSELLDETAKDAARDGFARGVKEGHSRAHALGFVEGVRAALRDFAPHLPAAARDEVAGTRAALDQIEAEALS